MIRVVSRKKYIISLILAVVLTLGTCLGGLVLLLGLNPVKAVSWVKFLTALRFIETQYVNEVDETKLLNGALSGMVQSLGDPHSIYLDKTMYKSLMQHTEGTFGGVGIVMGFKDNKVMIISVMDGTPGKEAGLQAGDEIIAVDQKPVVEMQPEEVALKVRGEAGTNVVLTIKRNEESKDYILTRGIIQAKTAAGEMLPEQIGYIRIASFSENTGKEFKEAYAQLEEQGMKGLIIDLRENPGGLVTSCVEIANMVVPQGKIVSVVQRDGTREDHMSQLPQAKYPLVVLIDGNSASASEILAGALQDTQAAVLVGTKSYGKGSVQAVIPLPFGEALKLTIAKYYTPNGRSIDGTGIEPDEVVEQPAESTTDLQLAKAIEVMKNKLK